MTTIGPGEKLAKRIVDCNTVANSVLCLEEFFMTLPRTEQLKCMSWLLGAITSRNQKEALR